MWKVENQKVEKDCSVEKERADVSQENVFSIEKSPFFVLHR